MLKVFSCSLIAILLSGCADLVVEHVDVNWAGTNRISDATIKNRGLRRAGPFLVYFNADENPVSPNHRPQVIRRVDSLASGASIQLSADFAPLAHQDNANLGNVYQITVIADPKDMVKEWNEGNNERSQAVSPLPLVGPYNLTSTGNATVSNGPGPDDTQWRAQTFTMTHSGRLRGIEVAPVRCTATVTDQLTLEIGRDTTAFGSQTISGAGIPGPGLCGVIPAPLSLASTGPGYFDLSGLNLILTAGQTYYFKLTTTAPRDFRVGMSVNASYDGGTAIENGTPFIQADLAFKIVIQP